MSELKLYHRNVLIGVISNVAPEDNDETNGDIKLTGEFEQYKRVFDYLLANDGMTDGSLQPFDDAYFEGWSIVDADGTRKSIDIPAIHDNEIIWRDSYRAE